MNLSQSDTDVFRSYPKVELHRHLEGTLRIETMLEIARAHSITVPASLSGLVQVQDGDPLTFQNFLAKFNTLRLFYRSPDVIHRITREAVEDAAKDNVRYLELRFTPVALSRAERFPLHDVMNWVITSAREAAKKYKMKVGLIVSVNRHESPELAEQVAWLAAEHIKDGMVGMDLAGNEADFPAQPLLGIFKEARQAGLHSPSTRASGQARRTSARPSKNSAPSASVMACACWRMVTPPHWPRNAARSSRCASPATTSRA